MPTTRGNSAIGSAAATVDAATTFNVTQTTSGKTLTLPPPTGGVSGHIVYVNSLAGNASFTMYGVTIAAGNSVGFIWNGTTWVPTSSGGSGVNTIGTIDSQTKSADGAVISGSSLILQTADGSNVGLVSTGAQTFAGTKTFSGDVLINGAGTGLSVQNAATIGNGLTITAGGETITAGDLALTAGNLTTNGVQRLSNAGALGNITGYTQTSGNFDASASTGTFKTSTGAVTLGGATTASSTLTATGLLTASNGLTLSTGNFDASASAGTFKTSTGAVSLNGITTVTGSNAFTVGTGATTLGGTLGVTGLGTFNGGLTVVSGSTFTNAGSSIFSSIAIANHASNSTIGSAASTVDAATTFDVTQTTSGITLTLPPPTGGVSGHVVYVNSLAGNASFTMYGVTIAAGNSVGFIWNGTTWVPTSSGGSGVNTIGTIDSQTKSADGAVISGSSLILQTADGSNVGLVSTGAQTFAGTKTFSGDVLINGAGTGLSVQNAATIGNGLTITAGGETITAGDLALTAGNLTTNGVQRLSNAGALGNITG